MSHSTRLRVIPALSLALLLLVTAASYGQTAGPKGQRRYVTVTGEILDMGCFTSHGLRGPVHRSCATQCLLSGVPMGLITADSTTYMLTENHDRAMAPSSFPPPDPYGQCRQWASFRIEVTGFMWERKGTRFLEVLSAKPAPPAETPGTP